MRPDACFGLPDHLRAHQARPASSQAQARCDAIQADFRAEANRRRSIRREPPPLALALVPTDDPLQLRLAEELDFARRRLELMGDGLSADPMVIARHVVALQAVDIIGQTLTHLAAVIRSSDPAGAVERIGITDLKARLTRTSID